jgi:hypothetical protein
MGKISACILALALALMCIDVNVNANVINASTCSSSDVQTAINGAANGDVVFLPAPCSTTWSSVVSIPGTKGITLNGNGAIINGQLLITTNASTGTRVTNFTFTRPGALSNATVEVQGGVNNARLRLDHSSFTGGGTEVLVFHQAPALVDHTTWTGMSSADETIHLLGWGGGNATAWSIDHTPGSTTGAIVFEDNTFTTASTQPNNAWMESFYGAISVWRYNTFNYFWVDFHGNTDVGTRWWEIYLNTFNGGSNSTCCTVNARDGSGIVYGNIRGTGSMGSFGYCAEVSGYPALYQIGRGTNQILFPAYSFLSGISDDVDNCAGLNVTGMVAANRDIYLSAGASCPAGGNCASGVGSGTALPATCTTNTAFWKTDAGGNWDTTHGGANDGALFKCTSTNTWTQYWVPSTYPDPLQSGGTAPTAPQNLRIVAG